ncbi:MULTISPECIES: helix-turn-helix domain-containing protein [Xanthomonas]|uniref:helix-turn-helix domain-containing protein n=1 Tax=Xanthomonas TaxID=338 RepID=UPI000E1EF812|nr:MULTISPECIES: helix-turn-helix transcriptional regulator [Xanthomonas]
MKTTHPPQLHPIRLARQRRKWSQQELGSRLNPPVGKAAVAQWESDTTRPVPDLAVQLVDLFQKEITLDDLYRRPGRAA